MIQECVKGNTIKFINFNIVASSPAVLYLDNLRMYFLVCNSPSFNKRLFHYIKRKEREKIYRHKSNIVIIINQCYGIYSNNVMLSTCVTFRISALFF